MAGVTAGSAGHVAAHNNRGLDVTLPPYNAAGDDSTDNLAAFSNAIEDAFELGETVFVPSGTFQVSEPIAFAAAADTDLRASIIGLPGRRQSRIKAQDNEAPIFQLSNTVKNLRGLTIANLALVGGSRGLDLQNCHYMQFQNVTFWAQREWAVYADNCLNLEFSYCWWIHHSTYGGDALFVTADAGTNQRHQNIGLYGCQVGEDTGGIHVEAATSIVGCHIYGAQDRQEPAGHESMGAALFTVKAGGRLMVRDSKITCGANLVNYDEGGRIAFTGNDIEMNNAADDVFVVLGDSAAQPKRFSDNNFMFRGTHAFYSKVEGGDVPTLLRVTDNDFGVQSGATFAVDPESELDGDGLVNLVDRNRTMEVLP